MDYIFLWIIFIISISFHEYAHAWASFKLGDPTAKLLGRLTPNPFKHIDPIGFLLIFLIGFWWGKPVPIDARYYKNPLRDELLVALAGPASNILMAIAAIIISLWYIKITSIDPSLWSQDLIIGFWRLFAISNVSLAVFNMIPVPPLDGYRIITYFYPPAQEFIMRYYHYLSFGFLILIVVVPFTGQLVHSYISSVSQFIFGILYWLVSGVFFW
jgi:Zn-dependent protease